MTINKKRNKILYLVSIENTPEEQAGCTEFITPADVLFVLHFDAIDNAKYLISYINL